MKQLLRTLLKDKLNTLILIVSLAIGFAGFNMILLFLARELGTDSFHTYKDRIYALKCDDPWMPGKQMFHCRFGSAEYMKENFSQVEEFCRISNSGSQRIIVNNEDYYDKPFIIAASSNFFSFFSYNLLTNNPETALESKNNIVISSELARKYFGDQDPVGQVIELRKDDQLIVSGIFEKPVENTQIKFDAVRLIGDIDSRCYVRLSDEAGKEETEKIFSMNKDNIPVINDGKPGAYYPESLHDAYFDTDRGQVIDNSRNKTDLLIAFIIGIMIIGIALFNYLGIITNRFLGKTREYSIRLINGGNPFDLVSRFMAENSVLIFISFLISIYLMLEILPFFNQLTGSDISKSFIFRTGEILILLSIIFTVFIITLLFVIYKVLPSRTTYHIFSGSDYRIKTIQIPGFNIFQIASTIVLIICSIVIIMQMRYITNKPIGLDKEVIEVRIPSQFADKSGVFREELMKSGKVDNVAITGASPLLEHFLLSLHYQQDGVEKQYAPAGFSGDENYLDVLGIQLIEGEGFSNLTGSSGAKKCLINQAFARLFAGQDLLGKGMPGMEETTIIGIVKDFHYSSLKSWVEPAFISYAKTGNHLLVKPAGNQVKQVRELISEIWKELVPGYPVNTESIGERYEWYHRDNRNYLRLIGACSLISIFLSMIGIFAISYQNARLRTKEIGIRKINGAITKELLILINRDFIRWIAFAYCIAVPASWFVMYKWLENYAYKTRIYWWVFALAGIIVLAVTFLTVSLQSWRAATRNPVESLRYE